MKCKWLPVVIGGILLMLLTACASQTVSPTETKRPSETQVPTVTASATATIWPTWTATNSPTITTTPTETLFPPLSDEGPYLVLISQFCEEENNLVLFNSDGSGRKILSIPHSDTIYFMGGLQSAISPDGKWITINTGEIDSDNTQVTLNIMSLEDGSIHHIANVATSDYLQKLSQISEIMPTVTPELFSADISWIGPLDLAFRTGIYESEWSPNGEFLAFAGQIDGNSSDLYLYDMEQNEIQRISDDLMNLYKINWSDDGNWILYQNSIPGEIYQHETFHTVKFEGNEARYQNSFDTGYWWKGLRWIPPNQYLFTYVGSSGPGWGLGWFNVESGKKIVVWEDMVNDIAIDSDNQLIILSSSPSGYTYADQKPRAEDGLYLISMDGSIEKISDEIIFKLTYRGIENSQILGHDGENILSITYDGSSTIFSEKGGANVKISPNGEFVAVYDNDGLELFNETNDLIFQHNDIDVDQVLWRPDSKGLFLEIGYQILYLNLPEGEITPIDDGLNEKCYFLSDGAWIP